MKDLIPPYAAGTLDTGERDRVRAHLAECPGCRADLAAWQTIAAVAAPSQAPPDPARLVRAVLTRSALAPPAQRPAPRRLRRLTALVPAEARLIRPAVPIASALVMALGVALVLLQPAAATAGLVLSLVAPIVAAAGVAGAYRAGRDPAGELIATLPTSGRLLLLVRITLVFGYDLVLALLATAGLGPLVSDWLGPMALLSAVSLLIAVRFGPDVALGVAVGLWAVRVLATVWPIRFIVEVWVTNAPVLAVSAVLAILAFLVAGRGEPRVGRPAW